MKLLSILSALVWRSTDIKTVGCVTASLVYPVPPRGQAPVRGRGWNDPVRWWIVCRNGH